MFRSGGTVAELGEPENFADVRSTRRPATDASRSQSATPIGAEDDGQFGQAAQHEAVAA